MGFLDFSLEKSQKVQFRIFQCQKSIRRASKYRRLIKKSFIWIKQKIHNQKKYVKQELKSSKTKYFTWGRKNSYWGQKESVQKRFGGYDDF